MKKLLAISVSLLLLAGCSQNPVPAQNPPATPAPSQQQPQPSPVSEKPAELPKGAFVKDEGYYGITYVKGYASTQKVSEPFCDTNCKQYTYVDFNIAENNDPIFQEYLAMNNGNSFGGPGVIGLGCVESGVISYQNNSDKLGAKQVTLKGDLSKKILESTKANPVMLKLKREKLLSGSGAPACYSHMTNVELYEGVKN